MRPSPHHHDSESQLRSSNWNELNYWLLADPEPLIKRLKVVPLSSRRLPLFKLSVEPPSAEALAPGESCTPRAVLRAALVVVLTELPTAFPTVLVVFPATLPTVLVAPPTVLPTPPNKPPPPLR